MTNGEKLIEVFPSIGLYEKAHDGIQINFNSVWFKAEYKEPNKSEIPTGSTTRNCFGCKYSKDNHNAGTEECHLCMWENQYTPTTKNDLVVDCISREQALNEFCIYNPYDSIGVDKVRSYLKALPPVTPQEPRKGHWVKTPKAIMGEGYMWYCDKCNHEVYQDSSRSYPSEKYCPNCGSDNREVEE